MTMYVLIEYTPEGTYTASLLGWPAMKAQGTSEDEALSHLRHSLTTRLQQARIVPVELDLATVDNPWLALGDRFPANPLLDDVTRAIADYRNEDDDQPEAV